MGSVPCRHLKGLSNFGVRIHTDSWGVEDSTDDVLTFCARLRLMSVYEQSFICLSVVAAVARLYIWIYIYILYMNVNPLKTGRERLDDLTMTFLIPALVAGASDSLILYLSASYKGTGELSGEEEHSKCLVWMKNHPSSSQSRSWFLVQLLIFARLVSLFLGAIMNASYMNILAIIRLLLLFFPLPYHSYTGTAVKCPLLYQLLYGISIMVLLGHMLGIIMLDPDSLASFLPSPNRTRTLKDEHHLVMRHVWIQLSLSLLSTGMHILLLCHVRSSAPYPFNDDKRRKRVLYYYAQQQHHHRGDESNGNGTNDANQGEDVSLVTTQNERSNDLIEQMKLIPEGYDDFMSDLQSRLHRAKQQWSSRLEDFTKRVTSSSSSIQHSTISNRAHPFLPTTSNSPFRVLLQLFAYQEVLANEKLNQAFLLDNGEAMTFHVPQLLSFLLHGAYDNSPTLETWILEKCKENVHFAHACYWFLRAWCLEGDHAQSMMISLTRNFSDGSLHHRTHSNASSVGSSWSGGDELMLLSAGSSSRLMGMESPMSKRSTKYYPEERTLIEGLIFRVMECGEIPARVLQYGSGTVNDDMNIPEKVSSSSLLEEESGLIPVDPESGVASAQHMGSVVTATCQYGFLPLEHGLDRQPLPAGGCFMETPRFLDALLTMADNLFLIPRDRRLQTLRRQLKTLQVEFLPSNSIYLPVHNVYHRVWRIVADESIAISTKERVPCIIYFEVINYDAAKKKTYENGSAAEHGDEPKRDVRSDRETIYYWQHSWRDPQRHNSLLDKVTNFTHLNWKRFREHHGNDALFWINVHSTHWRESAQQETLTDDEKKQVDLESGLTPQNEANQEVSGKRPPLAPSTSARSNADAVLDGDTPTTPPVSSENLSQIFEMGQWSSPNSASTMPKPKTGVVKLKNKKDDETRANEVMDSLVGIRSSMERFENHDNGSLGESPLYSSSGTGPCSTTKNPSTETRSLSRRKSSRPPPVVFKESFDSMQERVRSKSAYGSHPGWRLLPVLIKSNDDLRQEQLASQLIYRVASILAREKVPVWLCAYEIVALTETGGVIEAIPDTISIDSLKRNSKDFTTLGNFFLQHFGERGSDDYADAKACFIESLAAYSMVCFLLQIKDRHNGNILVDNRGHLIHIDFGFFFLSSPGKNSGFESAPFKLTRDFVDLMDGPDSKSFRTFRELCCRTFLSLRRHCYQITLLVEMLMVGNEDLPCFRGRPEDAVSGLRERFRLDLNDRACAEYCNALIDESLENWRTRWYDRYQRYCVGVL
jgi:phosphatidylinositol 4-kinase